VKHEQNIAGRRRDNNIVFLLAAVTHDSSLTGRWTATLKKGDRTGTASLRLGVSGTEVTRTLSDPSGQVWEIRNGNLQGNQLTFDVTAREHGGTKNIHFFGQVEEGALTLQNESRGRPGQTMTFYRVND
jgi:hypothetical protein